MSYEASQIGDVSKDLLVDLMFNIMGTDAKSITGSNPDQVANKKPALNQRSRVAEEEIV